MTWTKLDRDILQTSMKRYNFFHVALMALCILGLTGCAAYNQRKVDCRVSPAWVAKEKYQVAVLPFKEPVAGTAPNSFGGSRTTVANGGEAVADAVSSGMLGVTGIQLVERAQLKKILEEHNLSLAELFESPDLKKLKGVLPIHGLILGTVTEFCNWHGGINWGSTVGFNGRLVDVDTGQVLLTFTCSAQEHNGVPTQMALELASEAAKKVNTELQRKR